MARASRRPYLSAIQQRLPDRGGRSQMPSLQHRQRRIAPRAVDTWHRNPPQLPGNSNNARDRSRLSPMAQGARQVTSTSLALPLCLSASPGVCRQTTSTRPWMPHHGALASGKPARIAAPQRSPGMAHAEWSDGEMSQCDFSTRGPPIIAATPMARAGSRAPSWMRIGKVTEARLAHPALFFCPGVALRPRPSTCRQGRGGHTKQASWMDRIAASSISVILPCRRLGIIRRPGSRINDRK